MSVRWAFLFRWRYALAGLRVGWNPLHGDGKHDNTRALQARFNAASLLGGRTIYLPPGEYRVSATVRDPA